MTANAQTFTRYQSTVWQDRDGLASNTINALARTRDGYLWIATVDGLSRFDGVRFTTFDSANTPELKSSWITALLEDRAGSLWIGTQGGLVQFAQGRFTQHALPASSAAQSNIACLLEDRTGALWIGTSGGGLLCWRAGQFTTYTAQQGLPSDSIRALAEDASGNLWIGTADGLARWQAGQFTRFATQQGGVRTLCVDPGGKLWLGLDDGDVQSFEAGQFSSLALSDKARRKAVQALRVDAAGVLWVGAEGGLFRYDQRSGVAYNTGTGLPADNVQALLTDADGACWIGLRGGGLVRFRHGPLRVITTADGLAHDKIRPVFSASDGSVWIGTVEGLTHLRDGQSKSYTTKDGLPENLVYAIGEDRAGRLWFGSRDSLCNLQDGRFVCHQMAAAVNNNRVLALLGDRAGNLWVGTRYSGLSLYQNGQFKSYTTRDGLVDDYVQALYEDRAGRLWIGTRTGLSCWHEGRFTNYTTAEGLAGNDVLSFYEDAQGNLWIGTHGGGLSRWRAGQFKSVKVKDGLYDNLAFQMLPDSDPDFNKDGAGNLWMSCNKGIYRVSLRELNDFVEGRRASVQTFAYGVEDGMLSRECNGAFPAGARTRDGQLWFPTVKGVVVIDPQRQHAPPPLLQIEKVMVDGVPRSFDATIQISPAQESLEVQYAALSWERPHAIRFKYQLAGLNDIWTDAGTRRAAYFQHLPPGNYSFRVMADNGEGIWSDTSASFSFVVETPFYRTWWFAGLVLGAVAGLAWSGYRWRVKQLQRVNLAQQEFSRRLINAHEGERQRIAAELHDGLSQSLAIIRQRATICLQAQDDPQRQQEQMEEIAEAATAVIDEVREIIYDLRPVQLDRLGLTQSLREMLDKVSYAHGLEIQQELDELDGHLPKESENSLYRIVQEAVNNIVRHAQATHASVKLKRESNSVHLTVSDDGCGFIPDASRDWVAGSGLGLTSIHERARLLRGELLVESAPQQGTTITLRLPLP